MTLEQALQENTQAIRELIAQLAAGAIASVKVCSVMPVVPAPMRDAVSSAVADINGSLPAPQVATEGAAVILAAAPGASVSEPITYASVKAQLIAISKVKPRNVLVDLLNEFGVTNGSALTADQYAAVLARANQILAT